MNVLLVEDNIDLAANIGEFLELKGYSVDYAHNGDHGHALAIEQSWDAIVLDLMLPGKDGISIARSLRTDHAQDVPVLMLTARDTLANKLEGFDAGADDYLVKPFALEELAARLAQLIKRNQGAVSEPTLQLANLSYNRHTESIQRGNRTITLKPAARKILALLMRNSHRVVRREEIETEIWGQDPPDSEALAVHIHSLRRALELPSESKLLHTIRGSGYRLYEKSR